MKKFFIAATCAVFFPCISNAQNWQFLETVGGTSDDIATAIATDPSGSANYSAGTFTNSITFGQITFTGTGTVDGYVTKYSSNGTMLWATHIRTTHEVQVTDIAYATGVVYLTGYFTGSIYVVNDSALSVGAADIFIMKLNAVTGTLMWLNRYGGLGDDRAEALTIGSTTFCIGGSFEGSWILGTDTLQSYGGSDVLIVAFDLVGVSLWSRTGGGPNDDQATSLAVDGVGNCYAIGAFVGTVAFGPATLTSMGGTDVFVLNYSSSGVWGWIRSIYGTGEEYVGDATSDLSGHVYVVGRFSSPLLNFMSQTLMNPDSCSGFLAVYDANGYVSWACAYPKFICQDVACTSTNIFVAGTFSDSCSFGLQTFVSAGVKDICIMKVSVSGVLLGAHQCGGIGCEEVCALTSDQNGTVYLAGSFFGQQTCFTPYTVQNEDATGQTTDAYIGKFPATLLALDEYVANKYVVYPNPFTDYLIIEFPATLHEVVLSDMTGKEIMRISGMGYIRIDRADLAVGMYILAVIDTEGINRKNTLIGVQ